MVLTLNQSVKKIDFILYFLIGPVGFLRTPGPIWVKFGYVGPPDRGYQGICKMVGIPCVERGVPTFGKIVCSLPGDNWFIP